MRSVQQPPPKSILVRGVNWLGDAVMSTPALLRLREAYSEARITILTPAKLSDLWQHHPAVDAVISFAEGQRAWAIARRLREDAFELAVILPNSFRAAFEVWLAGIPRRIGYRGQWRGRFLTEAVPCRPRSLETRKRTLREIRNLIHSSPAVPSQEASSSLHHIHQYLRLMSCLGANSEPLPPELKVTESEVEDFLRRWRIEPPASRMLFGLNPGAEYGPAKRWPSENFAAAAIDIQKRTNCCWLIFGGPTDAALAAEITARIEAALNPESGIQNPKSNLSPVLNLAGRTSLRELCAGLKACRVLLTNDTGPMHVAAALGTPVVALFGSTSPNLTGPGLPNDPIHRLFTANVSCSPCFLRDCPIDFRCMKRIEIEPVVDAVVKRGTSNAS